MNKHLLCKRIPAFLTALVILAASILAAPCAPQCSAAKKVCLNKKTLQMTVKQTVTLKLKNTKKKVTWKITSGKKVVKLTSKKKNQVKITAKKTGKAKVQAMAGKKKYICNVQVKAASKKPNGTVSRPTASPTSSNTGKPTAKPATVPTSKPTAAPTDKPTTAPTGIPTAAPTGMPTGSPIVTPTDNPSVTPGATPSVNPTTMPTSTPVVSPTQAPTVTITTKNGNSVSIGDSVATLKAQYGEPARIDTMPQGFEGYVYNPGSDYSQYMIIGVADNKVVMIFTVADDFQVYASDAKKDAIAQNDSANTLLSLGYQTDSEFEAKDSSTKEVLGYVSYKGTKNACTVMPLCDALGKNQLIGVYIYSNTYTKSKIFYPTYCTYTSASLAAAETQNFEITNVFRRYHGLQTLTWSREMNTIARTHNQDMIANNYFSHTNSAGQSSGDRIRAAVPTAGYRGENISAGRADGIMVSFSWIASSGHRNNMLNTNYRYMGVGAGYGSASTYKTYFTQDFYQ